MFSLYVPVITTSTSPADMRVFAKANVCQGNERDVPELLLLPDGETYQVATRRAGYSTFLEV